MHELLNGGYRVRGYVFFLVLAFYVKPDIDKMHKNRAVRPAKVAFVQGWYTQYGDRVEIVPLDLTSGDYTTVLKGNICVCLLDRHLTDRWL